MTEKIGVDAPQVDRDSALEFMAHHLQLAVMYFEAVRESPETREEFLRLLNGDDRTLEIARPFYDGLFAFYEEMKDRD